MLFIHMGMHKAGSTTIQRFLADNAARLERDGIVYPEAGRGAVAHHPLAAALDTQEPSPQWATVAELAASATVVVSSEMFGARRPEALAGWLNGVETRILCWQRDAAAGLVSRYAQMTKRGVNLHPFDAFFAGHADSDALLAAPTLAPWAAAFGARSVRVRSVEPQVLEGGDLVLDLLAAIGAQDRPDYVRPGPQNVSPGWRALETIRALNHELLAGEPDEQARTFSRKLMPKLIAEAERREGLDERGAYLDRDQAGQLVERYNADIEALAALGVDARLTPLKLEDVHTSEVRLDARSVPLAEANRLLRRAVMLLADSRFRRPGGKARDED